MKHFCLLTGSLQNLLQSDIEKGRKGISRLPGPCLPGFCRGGLVSTTCQLWWLINNPSVLFGPRQQVAYLRLSLAQPPAYTRAGEGVATGSSPEADMCTVSLPSTHLHAFIRDCHASPLANAHFNSVRIRMPFRCLQLKQYICAPFHFIRSSCILVFMRLLSFRGPI